MSPQPQQRHARRVFISYSRQGGQAQAVSFYHGLVQVLGDRNVFLDVGKKAMEAGRSWKESVREALASSDALLLVLDPAMVARLNDPGNAVLFELESALRGGVRIACVRVDGARLPAATDLPDSLADLPGWHSPEVHSDAAVADIERVIEELTGRVPGQVPVLDRWDLVVLGVLAILGVVAWLSVGRQLLNLSETWLWGAAPVIPFLMWMAGRRALSIGNRGRATVSYRQATSWLAVLLVFGSGWLLAFRAVYRPADVAESGILVSRLAGDPSDQLQRRLVTSLRQGEPPPLEGDALETVAALSRRIGFSSPEDLAASLDDGHRKALDIGSGSRAAVVLWGRVLAPVPVVARLAIHLTFIESQGLFKTRSKVVGGVDARELDGLDSDIDLLAATLPKLLDGYRRYRAARSDRELILVDAELADAIRTLEAGSPEDPADRQALDVILASLRFLRGNTRLALGHRQEAIEEYDAAVRLTGGVEAPRYVEAASNLGWLLNLEHRLDEAIEVLTNVDRTCEGGGRRQRACAYAWYNLGDALSRRDEHSRASEYFQLAIERLEDARETEDRRLRAYARQYLAYSLVRRAATGDGEDRASLLDEAGAEWHRGVDALERSGLDVPAYFRITLARIHVERSEWRQAIEILTGLEVPSDHQASVHALMAGAYSCLEDLDLAETHLKALLVGPGSNRTEGVREIRRIKERCRART